MNLVVNVDLKWCDDMLKWNISEQPCFNRRNRSEIFFRALEVWTPDIITANGPSAMNRRQKLQYPVLVICNGNVRWSYPEKLVSFCEIDVQNFPFDQQSCSIYLQSSIHDAEELKLRSLYSVIRLYNFIETEWEIRFAAIEELTLYNVQRRRNFSTIKISIDVRRSSRIYLMKIILPFSIISSLALFSFCLPTDSGEKIALTVSTLLSITIYLQTMSDTIPKTEKGVCRLTLYANTIFSLVFLSCVFNILAAFMHYREDFSIIEHSSCVNRNVVYTKIHRSLICLNRQRHRCWKSSTELSDESQSESWMMLRDMRTLRRLLMEIQRHQYPTHLPRHLSPRQKSFQHFAIFLDRVLFVIYLVSMILCVVLILFASNGTSQSRPSGQSNQLLDLRKPSSVDVTPLFHGCPK